MFTKIFAAIEAINTLDKWVRRLVSEWIKYQISKGQGDLDNHYSERSVWLDAIKQAQREKDEQKVMYYSRMLATGGELPESGVRSPSDQRLSRL